MFETLPGLISLFLVMVLQVIIPPIPAEWIVIASGKLYGTSTSTLVAGSGLYLGSVAVYLLGFHIHERFDRFFQRDKVKKILEGFDRYHQWILWVRLLPYNPSDVIAYAAGIAKVNRRAFLSIGFFTSYIRCFLLSWMGAQIQGLKEILIILSLLVLCAVATYGFCFYRQGSG